MFIDTHCHPYLQKQKNKQDIFDRFLESGWKYLVSIWVDINTSKESIKLVNEYDFIFCSVWIHPCDVHTQKNLYDTIKQLEDFIQQNKGNIVAIWETGLDYYHKNDNATKQLQQKYFRAHIRLAKKYSLPFIIHNRNSKDDIFKILLEENYDNFIFHCYSENLEYAKNILSYFPKAKISFSGIVTFKNAWEIQNTAQNIPLKNILIETDAPYLTPTPYRWKEENEPLYTKYILEKIIELREEPREKITETIYNNSTEVFWIKK